ncbi:MAG: hypothetical protein JST22_07525 [Bacteroidetes bacterium]|nr:hypothetical protein [Bacteroidota bacterium]
MGSSTLRALSFTFPVLLLALFAATMAAFAQPRNQLNAGDYGLSGPFTHKNLTIYLVHGHDRAAGKEILTLQEALDRNLVTVYETGSVNELAIENSSADHEVFVQAGDIVRGGRQDRVLSYDLILPAKSGRIPIASFCVEHGRWAQRGTEPSAKFSTSTNQLAGRDLKLAAKRLRSQDEVWKQVEETQGKLNDKLKTRVNSPISETSMELALADTAVQMNTEEYVKALSTIIEGKSDVIGFVFAINGSVNSGDVYASGALFRKLWPKLLNACAVEAIAERKDGEAMPAGPTAADVRAALADPEKEKPQVNDVNRRVRVVVKESKQNVFFETRDRERNDEWVHRNYIKLD